MSIVSPVQSIEPEEDILELNKSNSISKSRKKTSKKRKKRRSLEKQTGNNNLKENITISNTSSSKKTKVKKSTKKKVSSRKSKLTKKKRKTQILSEDDQLSDNSTSKSEVNSGRELSLSSTSTKSYYNHEIKAKDFFFSFTIHDAHSFRLLMEIFKNVDGDLPMELSSNGIEMIASTDCDRLCVKVIIAASELTSYKTSVDDTDETICVILGTETFLCQIKNAGKQNCLKISNNWSESKIFITIGKSEEDLNNQSNYSWVNQKKNFIPRKIKHNDMEVDITKYNCIVSSKHFQTLLSTIFNTATTMSAENIKIIGYRNAMEFKVDLNKNEGGVRRIFGPDKDIIVNYDEMTQKNECIVRKEYPVLTLRKLAKISNLSDRGTVKFFVLEDLDLIKIIIQVGTYGMLIVNLY